MESDDKIFMHLARFLLHYDVCMIVPYQSPVMIDSSKVKYVGKREKVKPDVINKNFEPLVR